MVYPYSAMSTFGSASLEGRNITGVSIVSFGMTVRSGPLDTEEPNEIIPLEKCLDDLKTSAPKQRHILVDPIRNEHVLQRLALPGRWFDVLQVRLYRPKPRRGSKYRWLLICKGLSLKKGSLFNAYSFDQSCPPNLCFVYSHGNMPNF